MKSKTKNKFAWKVVKWFEDPLVAVPKVEPEEVRLEEKQVPTTVFKLAVAPPLRTGGRGAKAPKPRRIDEFHPRGSAGQREFHSPKNHRKSPLPFRGKGTKHPQ
jgi:hypothetical protein